jgi:organic radical activating enzyme
MTDARDRQHEMTRSLDKVKAQVISLEASTQTLKQDSAARIQQITRDMAKQAEQLEKDHSQRVKDACLVIEQECEQKIAAEKLKFEGLVASAVAERESAQQAVDEYKNRLSTGDLVEASVLEALNGKLEEAVSAEAAVRGKFMELSDELTQTHKRLELMGDENTLLQSKIDSLNEQSSQLEISMRELVEQRSGSAEYAVLHERLDMRMQEIIKLKTELEKELKARKKAEGAVAVWKDRFLQLRSQGDGIIKTLNQRILTLKGQYAGAKAENGHFKIAMGVLGVLTTVLTATLWLTMFS